MGFMTNIMATNNTSAFVTAVLALLTIALALATSGVTAADTGSNQPTPVVQTNSGKVVGVVEQGYDNKPIYAFKGIPYAADPSGSKRWLPPQDPESWSDVRDTSTWGKICPQEGYDPDLLSEDCLVLNVFSPDLNTTEKAPVMVWIQGGNLMMGSSQDYLPQSIVSKDVVLVTINYRLGFLGYFAHPDLNATNFGLQDQVKALEWVQKNIGAFGGDPSQVTIFGQSAGGASVLALMVSPLSEGLFQGAISESGAVFESLNVTMSEAGKLGVAVGEALNISAGADQLEQMRSLPASDFLSVINEMDEQYGGLAYIYVDNVSMDTDILDGFKQGLNHDVPMLVGSNSNETQIFQVMSPDGFPNTSASYEETIKNGFGDNAETVLSLFPTTSETSPGLLFSKVDTDTQFGTPAYTVAESMANRSEKAYLYMFTQTASGEAGEKLGAFHGAEVYDLFFPPINPYYNISNPELADTMVTYWTQFARTGDPNTQGVPEWKPLNTSDEEWQILGPEVGSEPIPEDTKALYNAVETLNLNKAETAFMNQQFTNPLTLFL